MAINNSFYKAMNIAIILPILPPHLQYKNEQFLKRLVCVTSTNSLILKRITVDN